MASSSVPSRTPEFDRPLRPPLQLWQWVWPGLWVLLVVGSGMMCGWALTWLTRIPPLPNCEEITAFSAARDLLYCAETQARAGGASQLVQAVTLTAGWPQNHRDYDDADALLRAASEQILVLANRWAQAGQLDAAVDLASQIPLDTPLRQPAQAVIYEWRQDWKAGAALEAQLEEALADQDWATAAARLQAMKTLRNDYWLTTRYRQGQQRLQAERQAAAQLAAAQTQAAENTPAALQAAITLARQIPLDTHLWPTAEAEANRWSQDLLPMALDLWRTGQRDQALALANTVPPSLHLVPEAAFLLQISQAQGLALAATQDPNQAPTLAHLLQLQEAVRAAETLEANSSLQGTAQGFAQMWRAQFADLRQLHLAQGLARWGYQPGYEGAIVQAQQVEQGRPQRLQGQTLIANWRTRIERIEDRPTLQQARSLAGAGTVPALEAGIAKAATIPQGRALRIEAQTLIAEWRRDIQIIEDGPLLDEALTLADQGDLEAAIVAAQRVQPDRALHSRATTLIAEWTAAIQIAEDQPILAEAKDLAYVGSLTRAINLAATIAPGRALYDEAQHAIGLWEAERRYIWSIWAEQGRGPLAGSDGDDGADGTEGTAE